MGNQNAKTLTVEMNTINTNMNNIETKRDEIVSFMDKIINTLIMQQSYQDMINIQDEQYCNKLTGEMKTTFEKMHNIQVDTLFERITGNKESIDESSKCLLISEFYVTIYYLFNAILNTIYRETNGEDGKFNLCLKRLRQFILEVTTDNNIQHIEIGYRCSEGFDKETLPRLQDELGINSLRELYYDTYTLPVNNQETEELSPQSNSSIENTPPTNEIPTDKTPEKNSVTPIIQYEDSSDDDLNEDQKANSNSSSNEKPQTGGSDLYGIQRTMSDNAKLLLEKHTREFEQIFIDKENNGILQSQCDVNNKGKSYTIPVELLEDSRFKKSTQLLQDYASSLKRLIELNKNNIEELEAHIGFSIREGIMPIFVKKDTESFRINPDLKIEQLREIKTTILEKIKNIYNYCQEESVTTMTTLKNFIISLQLEDDIVEHKSKSITDTEEDLLTSSTSTSTSISTN